MLVQCLHVSFPKATGRERCAKDFETQSPRGLFRPKGQRPPTPLETQASLTWPPQREVLQLS